MTVYVTTLLCSHNQV